MQTAVRWRGDPRPRALAWLPYMDTVDIRGTHAEGSVPAAEVDLWQMRQWATGTYEIGWYRNGLWQRRTDALAQRDREAAWQVRLIEGGRHIGEVLVGLYNCWENSVGIC